MAATSPRVLLVDVTAHGEALRDLDAIHAILAPDERDRVDTLASAPVDGPSRAQQWHAAHVALRLALLDAGEPRARAVPFDRGARGKPVIADSAISFSLSHSGDHAAIAIASHAVGIDLERERTLSISEPRRSLMRAAARGLLSTHRGTQDQDIDVLNAWTILEAVAKATGDGIGSVLASLGIWGARTNTLSADETATRAVAFANDRNLVISTLAVPQPFRAALAVTALHGPVVPVADWSTATTEAARIVLARA